MKRSKSPVSYVEITSTHALTTVLTYINNDGFLFVLIYGHGSCGQKYC